TDADTLDIGWSLATTRSVFEHRAVVIGHDHDHALTALHALAAGDPSPDVVTATAGDIGPGPVLVFPG
ncbi:hypothetical protein, partial [Streptomyces mobaraensis]